MDPRKKDLRSKQIRRRPDDSSGTRPQRPVIAAQNVSHTHEDRSSKLPEADSDDAVRRISDQREKDYETVSGASRLRPDDFSRLSVQQIDAEEDSNDDDVEEEDGGGQSHTQYDNSQVESLRVGTESLRHRRPSESTAVGTSNRKHMTDPTLMPTGSTSRRNEALNTERDSQVPGSNPHQSRINQNTASLARELESARSEAIFPPRHSVRPIDSIPIQSSYFRVPSSNVGNFGGIDASTPATAPVPSSGPRGSSNNMTNFGNVQFSNLPVVSTTPTQSIRLRGSVGNVPTFGTSSVSGYATAPAAPTPNSVPRPRAPSGNAQNPRRSDQQIAPPAAREVEADHNDQDSDDDADTYPFTVLTDPISQKYVKIPQHELGERLDFLLSNKQLFKSPKEKIQAVENGLFTQAVDFSRMGKDHASLSCCLSLALIQISKNQHFETISSFFKALTQGGGKEKADLKIAFAKDQELVKVEARKLGALQIPGRSRDVPVDDAATITVAFGEKLETDQKVTSSTNAGDPSASQNPDINRLHHSYKVRNGAWFKRGRVFALLWHESAGEIDKKKKKQKKVTDELAEPRDDERMKPGLTKNFSTALYNSTVFSHIRRFVVLRNRHGYCWCVSIGTYAGRGLLKTGLSDDDINAHTVVYDIEKDPFYCRREPKSNKRPIGVKMTEGATLDPMSRLHLGKPFNVEWNVKVMDVGMVVPADLPALIEYTRAELFG